MINYEPKIRKSRGIYYTPLPIVSYLIKSVDYLLKKSFKINQGLGDAEKITIVDPAVGEGVFMEGIIKYISDHGIKPNLPRLYGFELLETSYQVAQGKLQSLLGELGYDFSQQQQLNLYLSNTLQLSSLSHINLSQGTTLIIIGNPPYVYQSLNTDAWIVGLVRDYYQVEGQSLGERNPKGLLDDYVKFIRFAEYCMGINGAGIVAFITNNGYLDNPTFRGMRYNLMQTFDEIYVLDLHGNSKKKEICPDGSPDQNVFGIQQGVAIGIFVKYQNSLQKLATVYHGDLWGVREIYENQELVGGKYHWLGENDWSSTNWEKLEPTTPFYLFKFQNNDLSLEYQNYPKITDFMPFNSVGVVTSRDSLTIQWTKEEMFNVVNDLVNLTPEAARLKYNLGPDTRDWIITLAQQELKATNLDSSKIVPILYRPFDLRYTYYTGKSRGFHSMPRGEVMKQMMGGENLGLITCRQRSQPQEWGLIGVTNSLIESCAISNKTREINYLFPLYLYPRDKPTLFEDRSTKNPGDRHPNLAPQFITEFSSKLNLEFIPDRQGNKHKTFEPEDIFNYIYAIFHSPTYRQRYAEFLKIDFPRVPLTSNTVLFWKLVEKGEQLVQLHLMKETGREIATYPIAGFNLVEQVKYNENQQQVWINSEQYFTGVTPQIWNFYIGGYQVCQKWLKDRKGRKLTFENISYYQNIIAVLRGTIQIMNDVDQLISKFGGFPIK